MGKLQKSVILGFVVALLASLPLQAQQTTTVPAESNSSVSTAATGQAPDNVTNKITELVHAGKYSEAQQLTTGLLVAYPQDQRLIKAKALLDKLLVEHAPGRANQQTDQPVNSEVVRPRSGTNAEPLDGIEKVNYNALLELAREAQQATDVERQTTLLKKFMADSSVFLRDHPTSVLLYKLRAAAAISLDDAMAGYEAGQKLLDLGAADSDDSNVQRLLAQLKNKGWLDKQAAEDYKKYGWILGVWSVSWSSDNGPQNDGGKRIFLKSTSGDIEGYVLNDDGSRSSRMDMRGTFDEGGQIMWELNYWPSFGNGVPAYPSGWQRAISWQLSTNKRAMKLLNQSQWKSKKSSEQNSREHPLTHLYTKISDSPSP